MAEGELQQILDICYHIEGCAAMLIGCFGSLSGFLFGKYFFDRVMKWM